MLDADRMIHATGHFGKVVIEPLTDAEARIGGAAQVLRP
jgi:hypothetical protein